MRRGGGGGGEAKLQVDEHTNNTPQLTLDSKHTNESILCRHTKNTCVWVDGRSARSERMCAEGTEEGGQTEAKVHENRSAVL